MDHFFDLYFHYSVFRPDCRLPFDRAAFENFEVVEEPATERRHNKSTKRRKADHQCGMDGGPVTGQPADKHISGVDRTPDSLGHGGSGGDVGAPESRRRRRCRRKLGKLGEGNMSLLVVGLVVAVF